MKYVPDFPHRLGFLANTHTSCGGFFAAYNHEQRHSGVGLHTPTSIHSGTAEQIHTRRQTTLDACAAHPNGSPDGPTIQFPKQPGSISPPNNQPVAQPV
jgi:putative transposase